MTLEITVENIKCGGCASTIRSKLEQSFGVPVRVDIEQGVVSIEAAPEQRDEVAARLKSLGYPQAGTARGLQNATAKARSFVSCAVGRMSSDEQQDE